MPDPIDPDKQHPPTVAWDPSEVEAAHLGTDPDDPLIGSLIRDKWRILSRIGAGSFGTVYKVRDEAGGWIEALKILRVDRLRGPEGEATRARFLREARIMKRLGAKSRHIVRLSTYEEDLDAGLIYFLMEHVEGQNLAEVLESEGPFTIERVLEIALQVCDALVAAHESDPPVVHRDLKLQNLMLTEDDDGSSRVMVLDFGIAKITESDVDSRLTTAGAIGTPGYAAPEQIRAEEVDGRTDLFALGVILYALLTGRDPWLGKLAHEPTEQVYQLMAATDRAEVIAIRDSRPDAPDELVRMVNRLLKREPDERFQSARSLREAIMTFAGISTREFPAFSTQDRLPPMPKPSSADTIPERRLAAVWFADLVGYSSLSATDEGAALALLDTFHSTARKVIEAGGGRVVQFIGDAAFAEFSSTERAVRTAVQFHDEFALATDANETRPLLRTGVHVGDVLMASNGDLFGDGVNVAARIQNEAEPGQILVSQDVWRQLKQRRDFHFASVGERKLKGLGAPVWLFAVVPPEEATATSFDSGTLPAQNPTLELQAQRGRWAHIAGVATAHLAASGVMLWVSTVLRARYGFPDWVTLGAAALLAVGLITVLVTSWTQTRPTWERSVTVLGPWSLDLADVIRSLASGSLPELTWARTMAGGVAAFSVLFAVAAVLTPDGVPGSAAAGSGVGATSSSASGTVAILPFEVAGTDVLLSEGVPDLVAYAAAGVGVPTADPLVLRRQISELGGAGSGLPARVVQALDSRYAVTGSVTGMGSTLELSALLVDVRTGEEMSTASVSGTSADLGTLVVDLTAQLLAGSPLADQGSSVSAFSLAASEDALLAFLEGEQRLRDGDWGEAVGAFGRAKDSDPDFALALARLAFARFLVSAPGPHLRDADATRGLELGDQLPTRERRVVEGLLFLAEGSGEAVGIFDELARTYPGDPDAWYLLGDALYHVEGPSGSGATQAFERAIALAGEYEPASAHLVGAVLAEGDTRRARALIDDLEAREPGSIFLASLEESLRVTSVASGTDNVESASESPAAASPSPTTAAPAAATAERPPVASRPASDPLASERSAYAELLRSVEATRADAVRGGLPSALQPRLSELDALRTRAESAAASGGYDEATRLQQDAGSGYSVLGTDVAALRRYEAAVAELAPLRSEAEDAPSRGEAERLERDAAAAASRGDYEGAVTLIGSARAAWNRAVSEATNTASTEAAAPPPPAPAEITSDVLDRLAAAISAEDMGRVRSVWTSLSDEEAEGLRGLFGNANDIRVSYDVRSVSMQSASIDVSVHTTYRFILGGRDQTAETEQDFALSERGGTWVITASRTR